MSQVADAADVVSSSNLGGITRIVVSGFKSLHREQSAEIRPLTILAGANSSGKSSLMQPLLLQKQTLDSTYDPGVMLLNGPHVRLTSVDQMFSKIGKDARSKCFRVGLNIGSRGLSICDYKKRMPKGIDIQAFQFDDPSDNTVILHSRMTSEEIQDRIVRHNHFLGLVSNPDLKWTVVRNRCFLDIAQEYVSSDGKPQLLNRNIPFRDDIEREIQKLIHVPGLRGNPERTYPLTAVGAAFPGTFENYTASVIAHWQQENAEALDDLGNDLKKLGLTWKVAARSIDDTQVEIQVARLPQATRGGAHDLVSIADVGFGLSQTLPVLVALRVAKPGQLVYLEQPEIHLHPRAQTMMAEVIADAAKRGVRVVVETHSAILILGVQTLVAEGKLSPDLVKLHWFNRQPDGSTEITSADLDEAGAFGDWPEDFADVELKAQSRFLNAAEAKLR